MAGRYQLADRIRRAQEAQRQLELEADAQAQKRRELEREAERDWVYAVGRMALRTGYRGVLTPEELEGMFEVNKAGLTDEGIRRKWAKAAAVKAEREAAEKNKIRERLRLEYPSGQQNAQTTSTLKALGLHWDGFNGWYQGRAVFEEVQPVAEAFGGSIERLDGPPASESERAAAE